MMLSDEESKYERTEIQGEDGWWSVTATVKNSDGTHKVLLGYDQVLDAARLRFRGFLRAWLESQLKN